MISKRIEDEISVRERFLTDVEAASVLGLGISTLRNWRHLRKGPPYTKFGRAIRYPLTDLLRWAKEKKLTPPEGR